MATPTASDIARLRRMVAEPGATNGYSDTVLSEAIERYPVPDSAGVYPVDEDGVANTDWVFGWDLSAAASEIWTEKAAALAATYDFSADGGDFKRSQAAKQAREMASYYASRRYARGVRIKADINPGIESAMWIFNLAEAD